MNRCLPLSVRRRQVLVWSAAGCLTAHTGGASAQVQTETTPPLPVTSSIPSTPAFIASALGPARMAGSSLFRYWGFDVYQASLWITPAFQASAYWQTPFALALGYLRALEGPAIARRSLEEMQRAGTLPSEQAGEWLEKMVQVFPNVSKGDTLTGLHMPGQGARFFINGQPLGDIASADFSRRFFGIWLGTATSAPGLRAALLKGAPS